MGPGSSSGCQPVHLGLGLHLCGLSLPLSNGLAPKVVRRLEAVPAGHLQQCPLCQLLPLSLSLSYGRDRQIRQVILLTLALFFNSFIEV